MDRHNGENDEDNQGNGIKGEEFSKGEDDGFPIYYGEYGRNECKACRQSQEIIAETEPQSFFQSGQELIRVENVQFDG
jgi:hypothetical protein